MWKHRGRKVSRKRRRSYKKHNIYYIYTHIDRFTYKHDRYSLLLPQTLFQIYPNPQIHQISMHLLKESTGTPFFFDGADM